MLKKYVFTGTILLLLYNAGVFLALEQSWVETDFSNHLIVSIMLMAIGALPFTQKANNPRFLQFFMISVFLKLIPVGLGTYLISRVNNPNILHWVLVFSIGYIIFQLNEVFYLVRHAKQESKKNEK